MLERSLTDLLAATRTLKIASTGGPISPWLAAAYFAENGPFELRVLIEGRGKTFTNLRANPGVAVMIEGGNAFGLFAQAQGRAVLIDGAHELFRTALVAKSPESASLMAIPGLLPVAIHVERWLLTDVSKGWIPARELLRPRLALAAHAPA